MATTPLSSWVAIEPATGWTLEAHAGHVAIVPTSGDAHLRLSSFSVEETGIDAMRWIETAIHFNHLRGRPSVAVRCGDFVGQATAFVAGSRWFRGWSLRAEDFPLDVTYSCGEADAGRDDPAVDGMLRTLRFRDARRTTSE